MFIIIDNFSGSEQRSVGKYLKFGSVNLHSKLHHRQLFRLSNLASHTGIRSILAFNEYHIFMTPDKALHTCNQDLHAVNFGHLDHHLLE